MQEHIQRTTQGSQRGMTLVEVIAALAIIAAVIVGALALFENASSSQRATQLFSEVQGLRTAAQQMFMGHGSYDGLSTANLIASGKVPPTMAINGNTINTIFNGTATVGTASANTQVTIQVTNIPQEACTQLLMATNTTWQSIAVGDNNIPLPMTLANATGANGCAAGVNTITWTTPN